MRIFYTILIWCALFAVSNAQAWQITPMADAPEAITNNAVVEGFVNGVPYLYTFGGIDSTKLYSGIHLRSYRYNTVTDVWEAIASLPDTLGKIAISANRVKDKIYIIGGYHVYANGGEASSDKVHIYDPTSNSYLPDGASIPIPIDDQVQAVWRDSLIYVVTGWSNTGNVSAVQIYNPSTDVWQAGTNVPSNSVFNSFGASGEIIGDTIYYFGGASMVGNFNIQFAFRQGIIDPDNPSQISWSNFTWMAMNGYRMAATKAAGKFFWLGGSGVTYNYNGIAYNGSGGVSPNGRSLYYDPSDNSLDTEYGYNLPMDLRGIGNMSDTVKYIVGGMQGGQQVTAQTLRLVLSPDSLVTTSVKEPIKALKTLAFEVSPNPANEFLTVKLPVAKTVDYQLMTMSGVCLRKGVLSKKETQLNIKNLVAGVYFLQLIGEEGIWRAIGCCAIVFNKEKSFVISR